MRARFERAVVITGASSGIGRATARAFAQRGARLVLCARGEAALAEAVRECRASGALAIGVPTDVKDPEAVRRLAVMAAQTFGGIDVWVNNAGGGALGRFWEVPIEDHRATVELDFLGYLHGAYAALPYFLSQRQGVLINNISIGGLMPVPYAVAYAAAKAAARAFTDSLRLELAGDWPNVHVCAVYPTVVDTPGLEHAANYTGRTVKPGWLAVAPETVAETIVGLAEQPRREVILGTLGKLARLQHALAPRLTERAMALVMKSYFDRPGGELPPTEGNLFRASRGPMTAHAERGGGSGSSWPAVAAALGVTAGALLAARAAAAHSS